MISLGNWWGGKNGYVKLVCTSKHNKAYAEQPGEAVRFGVQRRRILSSHPQKNKALGFSVCRLLSCFFYKYSEYSPEGLLYLLIVLLNCLCKPIIESQKNACWYIYIKVCRLLFYPLVISTFARCYWLLKQHQPFCLL